jgi:hypothetical protein
MMHGPTNIKYINIAPPPTHATHMPQSEIAAVKGSLS